MTGGNRSGSAGAVSLPTASATYDPPNIVVGGLASTTIAVPGAAIGDFALASFSVVPPAGLIITAYVSAADTVTVVFYNGTASDVNLASGTLRAKVFTQ